MRRRLPLLLILVLVIGVVAGCFLVIYHHDTQKIEKKVTTQQKTSTQTKAKIKPQLSFNELNAQVTIDENAKKYKNAEDLINVQPKKLLNSAQYQWLLGTVYLAADDYKPALATFQNAATTYGNSIVLADGSAQAAQGLKDYKSAITYYQQAKQLTLISNAPLSNNDAADYDTKITKLEAML